MVAKDATKDIEIKSADKGKQEVIFKSTNAGLTKDQLIAAIGKKKDQYKVESVSSETK